MARPRVARSTVMRPLQAPHEPRCLSETRVRPRSESSAPGSQSPHAIRRRIEANGDRARRETLAPTRGQPRPRARCESRAGGRPLPLPEGSLDLVPARVTRALKLELTEATEVLAGLDRACGQALLAVVQPDARVDV